jgi:hypothetical protein
MDRIIFIPLSLIGVSGRLSRYLGRKLLECNDAIVFYSAPQLEKFEGFFIVLSMPYIFSMLSAHLSQGGLQRALLNASNAVCSKLAIPATAARNSSSS